MAIVAIPGAGGAQQGAVAKAFGDAGWTVRRTSRSGNDGTSVANLESGEGLAAVFTGADVVALTLPQDHRPGAIVRIAETVGREAAEAGVKHIVLNTGGSVDEDAPGGIFEDLRAARAAVRASGVATTVLQPTVYMDNLLAPWIVGAIVNDGVFAYPAPANAPIAWISHRSLADFFVAAATRGPGDAELLIGGPDNLTGSDMAVVLSTHLDRAVSYVAAPIDQFAAGIDQAMGAPAGERLGSLYARLYDFPQNMARDQNGAETLGVAPESFGDFLKRVRFGNG